MAVTIGTIKNGVFDGPGVGTTVTITNVTQDAGSNRYLYFVLQHNNNYTPTSVTYAGVTMTKIVNGYNAQSSYLEVYELANPTEGSNSIVLTYTQYQEYGLNIGYFVASCIGANGYGNTANNNGATPISANISSVGSGSAIMLIGLIPSINYNQAMTIDGTGVTEYYNPVGYNINYGSFGFKNGVTGGNCSIAPQYNYNMYAYAIEVKASVSTVTPTVTTTSITNITRLTADSGGNVTSDGGASVTARGVCWNTSTTPTTSNSKTTNGTGTGSFTSNITGLNPGTKYYVRAYATNSVGTAYGNELNFTSLRRIIIT